MVGGGYALCYALDVRRWTCDCDQPQDMAFSSHVVEDGTSQRALAHCERAESQFSCILESLKFTAWCPRREGFRENRSSFSREAAGLGQAKLPRQLLKGGAFLEAVKVWIDLYAQ
jgi:hypothetical protein